MSTAKEKVLAYFEKWFAKGINPANEFEVYKCVIHDITGDFVIGMGGLQGFKVGSNHGSKTFEAAARILKLDKPKAAEIQWEEDSYPPEPEVNLPAQQEWQSECGFYIVQLKGDDYHAVYEEGDYHREADLGYHSTPEAAKQACQDHKQKRLEDLL